MVLRCRCEIWATVFREPQFLKNTHFDGIQLLLGYSFCCRGIYLNDIQMAPVRCTDVTGDMHSSEYYPFSYVPVLVVEIFVSSYGYGHLRTSQSTRERVYF